MKGSWRRLAAAGIAAGAGLTLMASCNLVANIPDVAPPGSGGGGGVPLVCSADGDCNDDNPCTVDRCGNDGTCAFVGIAGKPAPASAQAPGDCRTIECVGGVAHEVSDDGDVPDDHQDCTIDTCAAGAASHAPKPEGTTCADGMGNAGRCDAQGACLVACKVASDCATSNPCVTAACDTGQGVCTFPPLPDGMDTPGVVQAPGDCHRRICLGGADVDQVDDSDVPVTATDCDTEACSGGAPSNPARPLDNPCSTFGGGQPGFCDGAGTCRQCAVDSECPGPTDECQHPVCAGFVCGTSFQPSGTLVTAGQTPGNCHKIVCDGAGAKVSVVDDADLPDDNNPCTNDICTAGATSHTTLGDGTVCGMAQACLLGQCTGCTVNSQCMAPKTCGGGGAANVCGCTPKSCTQLGQTCGAAVPDACFATVNCDDAAQDGGETDVDCGGNPATCARRCGNGKKCSVGTDCTSGFCADGVCCNSACGASCQACTAAKKGGGSDGVCGSIAAGTDPDGECADQGAPSCGNDGTCDGAGACRKYASGTVCVGQSCQNGATLIKQRTCNGSGTCVTPTPQTQGCAPYLCAANACTTTCASDPQCASGNYCSGGACVAQLAPGSLCLAANQCLSGFCVDGVCCTTSCGGACQACSAAKKQSGAGSGNCGVAKDAQPDPRNLCATTAPATCGPDGKCFAGACEKWPSATQCAGPSCSGGTLTTPKSCDGAGSCNQGGVSATCPGSFACLDAATCSPGPCGPASPAGDAQCAAGFCCDGVGVGACKAKQPSGATCARDGECISGTCLGTNTCL